MTLQQLKYIIKIVECRSITEAARQIYITQPALSNTVKEVELEIGTEIFNRTTKGISLTSDGIEFLGYARQVVEQADLLEQRYIHKKKSRQLCSFSTQHYAFAINAFINMLNMTDADEYEFTLRETRTYEIIEDVKNMKSEVGVLYLNDFNTKVISKLLKENQLEFFPLFTVDPHIFVSDSHPLAKKTKVSLYELDDYPFLSFEQGDFNSFYFSEEVLSTVSRKKVIHLSDRATMFNLLIGLNGYTICTGMLPPIGYSESKIVSIPLETEEKMTIGYILNTKTIKSRFADKYIAELKRLVNEYNLVL